MSCAVFMISLFVLHVIYLLRISACSCVLECIVAAILTLLLFEPYGMIYHIKVSAVMRICNSR